MQIRQCSLLLAALLGGCGESDSSSLDHYSNELERAIDDVDSAAATHRHDILAETDLTHMQALERMHQTDMTAAMGGMRDAEGSMMSCASCTTSAAAGPRVLCDSAETMGPMMDNGNSELMRHYHAMHAVTDVNAAHAEEQQHGAAMDAVISRMHTADDGIMQAMQEMMRRGMSMMCSASSHMHGSGM